MKHWPRKRLASGLCLLACLCWMPVLLGDEGAGEEAFPEFSVGGLLFGDLYHVLNHHSDEGEGATGLVLRRGYLTLDANFSKNWLGRLRFEANQSGEFETYSFTADFKDLYIARRVGRHELILGLSPTPTYDLAEGIWGLRYLMRTPLDLQGVASRDTGFASRGPLNASGSFRYRAMAAAGLEFGSDSSDESKWMGAVTWNPSPAWTVDLYVDFQAMPGPADHSTLQAFLGYQADDLRWGAQYSHQARQQDPPLELASAFAVWRLGEKTEIIGRIDRLIQPSPKGDNITYLPFAPSAPATLTMVGLERRASPRVAVTPNVVVITYDHNDAGVRPGADVHLRLTLFLAFQ